MLFKYISKLKVRKGFKNSLITITKRKLSGYINNRYTLDLGVSILLGKRSFHK